MVEGVIDDDKKDAIILVIFTLSFSDDESNVEQLIKTCS